MIIKHHIAGTQISWFGTGGIIQTLVTVQTIEELQQFLNTYKNQKFHILGNCTNTLIDDKGINLALKLKLNNFHINDTAIYAESSIPTTQFVRLCIEHSIGNLEFMQTIPGTIGGLLFMNAGAYGLEMKDVVKSVDIMKPDGTLEQISVEQMHYSYRHNGLPTNHIIIGATFQGKKQAAEEIKQSLVNLQNKRKASQPLAVKTLGSTFTNLTNLTLTQKQIDHLLMNNITINKNTTGYNLFVAQILENCGLKGYTIGGARFSEKHANFIENFNQATSADFINLTKYAMKIVKEKYDLHLKLEIKLCSDE